MIGLRTAGRSPNARRVLFVMAQAQRRGAELDCQETAEALLARGFDVDIAALSPSATACELAVDVLGPPSLPNSRTGAVNTTWQRWLALRARSRGCALVVAYGSTTLPACALGLAGTRTPFIYRSIGDPRAWVRGRAHRARTAIMLRRAAAVVCLWDGATQSMHDLYGVARDRLLVIPTGRDPTRLRPPTGTQRADARRFFGVADDALVLAVVGAIAPEKRVDLALLAAAEVGHCTVLVAGDGPERRTLEKLAGQLHTIDVRFLGLLRDVIPVFHAADLVVLASRTEGLPGVVIEAALCGVATITTNVGGVGELIDAPNTGIIVEAIDNDPARQTALLAEGLRRATSQHRYLGANARRFVEPRFAATVVVDGWVEVLRGFGITPDAPMTPTP